MAALASLIREARIERQLTQEMLGKRSGVGRRVIAKMEKTPGHVSSGVLLEVLGVLDPDILCNTLAAIASVRWAKRWRVSACQGHATAAKDVF